MEQWQCFSCVSIFLTAAILLLLYTAYELLGRKTTVGNLRQKAVLITGFGKELVIRCLQNGFTVFAGCHRECSVNELVESCGISRGKLYAFQMDVSDESSVLQSRHLVQRVLKESDLVLHAVVNNAGVRGNHFYDDFLTLDDYKAVWEVNVFGAIRVTQVFRDLIKQSRCFHEVLEIVVSPPTSYFTNARIQICHLFE
ncbi:unnamed protein product [Gongylonema pulchrum]|uniref:Dehydrogenase/reductase SDR family member 13 n=1 Tax=Gongylonema pulchrum TaxID=637853 RepID=A0A183EFM9_9BILA|nr:unnamed protein product [Gongylonema pulchrum]